MVVPSLQDPRRRLPALDRLLAQPAWRRLEASYGRERLVVQTRAALEALRARLGADAAGATDPAGLEAALAALAGEVEAALADDLGRPLARVLNATGIFLHTNLGRAPLPAEVAARLPELATAGCDLELDLATGRRGDRAARVSRLVATLAGAEAALAVNNNAGALVLALATFAAGREVVVSRGELVEIGGSFRIPEILGAAGARLVEVGIDQPHPPRGLRARDRPRDRAAAQGPRQQLPRQRLRRRGRAARARRPRPRPRPAAAGRRGQRSARAASRAAARAPAELPRALRGRLRSRLRQRRQAARRSAGGAARRARPSSSRARRATRSTGRCASTGCARWRSTRCCAATWWARRCRSTGSGRSRPRTGRGSSGWRPGWGRRSSPPRPSSAAAPRRKSRSRARRWRCAGRDETLARLRAGRPPVVGYLRGGRLILDLRTVDPHDDEALAAAVAAARE